MRSGSGDGPSTARDTAMLCLNGNEIFKLSCHLQVVKRSRGVWDQTTQHVDVYHYSVLFVKWMA